MNINGNLPPTFSYDTTQSNNPQVSSIANQMSPEQLRNLLASASAMKENGATIETNPDYAKLMNFLQYHFRRTQGQQQVNPQQNPNIPQGSAPINSAQLVALKAQIHAFKRISANQPLSEDLQKTLFEPVQHNMPHRISGNGVTQSSQIPYRIIDSTLAEPQKTFGLQLFDPSKHLNSGTETAHPQSLLPKEITASMHALQLQRLLIPSAMPTGIDPYSVIQNRETLIKNRINYRIGELETQTSNLTNEPSLDSLDYNLKIKAVIELKMLKLLDRQKKIREELLVGMSNATTLATAVDRSGYRRMKKQTLREARQTEKLERNQRQEKEKKEKQKHVDYLNAITNHSRDMLNFHRSVQSKVVRLGQNVIKFHAIAEKEEQKRLSKMSQERLKALREDDEEAYMKLLDEAKDTRITQILQQTNSYLSNLTSAVLSQKATVSRSGVQEVVANGEGDEEGEEAGPSDYYNTAHKITETVIEQPSIMVGGKLKEYQIKGLQWMVSLYNNRLNGILADEMGLGKTIQTISLVTYLIEKKKQAGPFLIIVPLSTITNWKLEFEKWAPSVIMVVFKGSPTERREAAYRIKQGGFNVVLTTYEYIIKERPVLSKIKWVHMIIDEGHRMKNANSKLSITLIQYYHSRYRLILTGTPLQNSLPELWALLNFVLPKIFNSVKSFDEWFNSPFASTATTQDRIDLNEEESLLIIRRLHKVLRPFLLRRLKKDVEKDLPDKVETIVKCKMSALQIRLYEQVRSRRTFMSIEGNTKGMKALNNMIMQFRKICNHPYVYNEVENAMNPTSQIDCNIWRVAGKFELLDRILPKYKKTGHRILMFFQMTQIMDIMEDYMSYRGHHFLRLDGSTKTEDRSEMLKLFNAPDSPYFIFLLSTRAGGLGLNLQTADTVIIFDSDWNPHQDLQAQDRAHRIGQTKEVRILRLITTKSVEEAILARAQYKLDIDGKVIQAGKFDNKTSEAERDSLLRELLGTGEAEEAAGDEDEKEELEDEELNEMIARSPEEIEIFKQIDAENAISFKREWNQTKATPVPERLMGDDELPAVYLEDINEQLEKTGKNAMQYGRGGRNRDAVVYDDGLSEEQWLNTLEEIPEDTSSAPTPLRKAAGEKGEEADDASRKRNRELDISPGVLEKPKKKKGKSMEETDVSKKRAFGININEPDPLSPALRKAYTRVFTICFKAVEEVQVEYTDSIQQKCALFLTLPNRLHYPDYYQLIQSPIAMDFIRARINSTYYKTPAAFLADFILMFDNARAYNVEGSDVYEDANELQEVLEEVFGRYCQDGVIQITTDDEQSTANHAIQSV